MATDGPRRCSIADTLGVVGDRWSLLVLRELSYGQTRFMQIQRALGAPRDVLTARLRKLEAAGIITRRPDPQSPTRPAYDLTPAGLELAPVLFALKEWGDRHLNAGDEPVVVRHDCGEVFHPHTHCAACGRPAQPDQLTVIDGDPPLPQFATSAAG